MGRKKRNIRIIICLIEVLLIGMILWSFVQPRKMISFTIKDMNSIGAIEVPMPESGWYVDDSMGIENGIFLKTCPVDLPRGSYKMTLHYHTNGGGTSVSLDAEEPTYRLIAGRQNMKLDSSLSTKEYEFYLYEKEKDFCVSFQYDGNGYAWISGVEIEQTWSMERMHLLYALLLISFLELIWFCTYKKVWYKIFADDRSYKTLITVLIVGIPVMLASLPCFSYYVINGFDLSFHMLRIEGIAEALEAGHLSTKIQMNWLKGYGYPISVFYGDLLLYLPAALRSIGMPLQNAYKIFIILVNAFTGVTMYLAAKGMTKSRTMAIFASYLYLLLPYRLSSIYVRAGVGEYCAMIFMPLVVWGIWRIYTVDITEKDWKYIWILPVIGFTGIIESHLLSTVYVGLFTLICCLVLLKKTFVKERFAALLKVVGATGVLNAGYFVPLLDYMRYQYKVDEVAKQAKIQTQGAYLGQIFSIFPSGDKISVSITDDLAYANEMVFSLGIVAWVGVIIFLLYFLFNIRRKMLNTTDLDCGIENATVYLLLGMGICTMLLSSASFPWDEITPRLGSIRKVFTSIQFPWRYLSLSAVFFILGGVMALQSEVMEQDIWEKADFKIPFAILAGILTMGFAIASAGYFTSKIISDNNSIYVAANCDLDDSKIMGAEYIPVGVNETKLISIREAEGINVSLTEEYSTGEGYVICVESAQTAGRVSVPRLYYNGYVAEFQQTKQTIRCYADELGRVCVDVPKGYAGNVCIIFKEPWYWRVAELCSFITVVGMCVLWVRRKAQVGTTG